MSFFKEFKEDLSQAVNELLPEEELQDTNAAGSAADLDTVADEDDNIDLDNFDELLKAVAGSDEDAFAVPEEPVEEDVEEAEAVEAEEAAAEPVVEEAPEQAAAPAPAEEAPAVEAPAVEAPVEEKKVASDESAVITKGTTIKGDIESDGSLEVVGTVTGNVSCTGKLTITGKVTGNSKASEIFADAARVEGEVVSEGTVKIGAGSVVIGNVTASSAVIAGAINGNIDVQGPVIVDSSAVIMGDIKSRSVQINNGAVIEGFCSQCYSDIDVKAFFADNK